MVDNPMVHSITNYCLFNRMLRVASRVVARPLTAAPLAPLSTAVRCHGHAAPAPAATAAHGHAAAGHDSHHDEHHGDGHGHGYGTVCSHLQHPTIGIHLDDTHAHETQLIVNHTYRSSTNHQRSDANQSNSNTMIIRT